MKINQKLSAVLLVLMLVSCAETPKQPPATTTPPVDEQESVAVPPRQSPAVKAWIAQFRSKAVAQGVPGSLVDQALARFVPIDKVMRLDKKQPEKTIKFNEYLANTVNDSRIAKGQALLAENREQLNRVSQQYGVKRE